ncbi:MAG TPA: N-acetylmuramoyl-L-alanine amidase [Anaerolineaceae bacterium]
MNDSNHPTQSEPPKRSQSYSHWKAIQSVFLAAILVATVFTLWTPANLLSNEYMDKMFQVLQPAQVAAKTTPYPTLTPSPRMRIGIVAGHYGHDSGAICEDGLREVDVNLKIATLVRDLLTSENYDVDLLKEFDPKLFQYEATALLSIHNDSCSFINDQATGFKVAAATSTLYPERAERLTECLTHRYKVATGMSFHAGSVTRDMTEYHVFDEVNSNTPAAIIETGFLNLDREILTKRPEKVALGIANGLLCYTRNENIPH